jgi:hypothetical protein
MGNQQTNLENKELLAVPGNAAYFTDKEGNIYSVARSSVPKKLSPYVHYGRSNSPYMRVKIRSRLWLVHRFIASVLIGRPLSEQEVVNHKNGVTTDNRLDNLEVVSQHENVHHAVLNNLYCQGEDWYKARGITKI